MSDLEQISIDRLKAASEMSLRNYGLPLVITDSGGKDSSVCKELAIRAGIPFEIMHNHTTADAPETVRFVRSEAKRFEELGIKYTINMPTYKGQRTSMWGLIPQKLMPPTILIRYCCSVLKETGGAGRFIATGVRWAESASRENNRGIYEKLSGNKENRIILNNDNDDKRLLFENCRLKSRRVVNPIIDWKDDDVYGFLEYAKSPMNPLYAEGWCRVGCIGCPLAGKKGREAEFIRWPKYKNLYIKAFANMLQERKNRGKLDDSWRMGTTGRDVFNWWMEYDILPGQIDTDEYLKMIDDMNIEEVRMDNHCVICGAYLADTGRMVCPNCESKSPERKRGKGVKFERIRRITGYLVGTLDKWNDAKKAEEKDRVKHSLGGKKDG